MIKCRAYILGVFDQILQTLKHGQFGHEDVIGAERQDEAECLCGGLPVVILQGAHLAGDFPLDDPAESLAEEFLNGIVFGLHIQKPRVLMYPW